MIFAVFLPSLIYRKMPLILSPSNYPQKIGEKCSLFSVPVPVLIFAACPGVIIFCPCPVPDSGGVPFLIFSGCCSWKIITKNFIKPPKIKNQSKVIQAACKNKSVENQAIKRRLFVPPHIILFFVPFL